MQSYEKKIGLPNNMLNNIFFLAYFRQNAGIFGDVRYF